ncbi:metallophosphoesterase [Pontibacter cellulosilyticus]|uniref:Metallophosphoesterase n=1 Tax=Pontibacter cellulosilyticus TaxID=1720253 RepID=A0A923N3A7_9BACT|nr:metallophosphoesterase [Pontibacter cellulosilyticus]MBC5991458.1 metallophosphoesterase [Pontibacter cellulosilyticus]
MLTYFLIILPTLFLAYILFSYVQELKYKRKPYYKLSDIGWQHSQPDADARVVHAVAMLGDVGAIATDGTDPVLQMLETWQQDNPTNSTVLFLGDNLYPIGLPPEGNRHRQLAEDRLNVLLDHFKGFGGQGIFISGNHDWMKGRKGGYQQMLLQQNYVLEHGSENVLYLPENGCLGPVTVQLAEGLLLLVLNTQWWVQRGEKPLGKKDGCPHESLNDFYAHLNQLLRQNRHQRILIAAHHPLYSNALHGGKFTVKQHIFPLTAAHKRFYIPLPIFGSIYPFYRQLFGAHEDMAHRKYKKMRRRLLRIFHRYNNIIYVAGHDHNLQHFEVQQNHYLVSGSGSKTAFVKKGGRATFTLEQLGFFTLNYYDNGEVWIEARINSAEEKGGLVVFRKKLESILQPQLA